MQGFKLLCLAFCLVCTEAIDVANMNNPVISKSLDEAVVTWRKMESGLKETLESAIKNVLPMLMRSGQEVNVSPECMADLLKLVTDLMQLKLWPLKFLDAIGKPEGGQMDGTSAALGDFQGCLNITLPKRRDDVKPAVGQYCMLDIFMPVPPKPNRVALFHDIFPNITFETEVYQELKRAAFAFYFGGFRIGLCVPSTCTKNDMQAMVDSGVKQVGIRARIVSCQIKEPAKWEKYQLVIAGVFICYVFLCIMATVFDNVLNDEGTSVHRELLRNFSLNRNFEAVFSSVTRKPGQVLTEFNGLRFLAMTWVILAHALALNEPHALRQAVPLVVNYRGDYAFQIIINGYFSVYTFFFITATLVSYNLVKIFDSVGPRAFNIPILIIRRYWRLTPSVLVVIGLWLLLPPLGTGPLWKETANSLTKPCVKNWWRNMLFINNYFHVIDTCVPHTWYLAAEFQMFVLSMLYYILLFRNPFLGRAFLVLSVVLSTVATGVVLYVKDFMPTTLLLLPDVKAAIEYYQYYYNATYSQVSVYCVGLAMGTFMARTKKVELKKYQVVIGWLIATVVALTLVYGVRDWNNGRMPTMVETLLYGPLHRPLWGMCLSWLVLACSYGYGGSLTRVLGWTGFQPFVRVSYLIYLTHVVTLTVYNASKMGVSDVSQIATIWTFFGNLSISFVVSVFLKVIFEGPLCGLDKLVFGNRLKKPEGFENVKVSNGDMKEPNGDHSKL